MPNYEAESEEVVATDSEIAMLSSTHQKLWRSFLGGSTRSVESRLANLHQLKHMIDENVTLISEAIRVDLGTIDVTPHLVDCNREIEYMIKNVGNLMKSKSVTSQISFANFPACAEILPEPLGVVLIVGTWNYPFHSAIGPLAGALASGNTVIVKPGSLCRASSRVIADLIRLYFDPATSVACVEGGREVMQPLLALKFGHIFFTGGTNIGKIIMGASANHLTPVTLELGGKNPVIVTESADTDLAARRIAWGKWACNAGQVCISPDHVYVHAAIGDRLIERLKKYINIFFPEGTERDFNYARIISSGHANRLTGLINASKEEVVFGGHSSGKYVSPTIMDFQSDMERMRNSECMKSEIFGPILPIVRYCDETALSLALSESTLAAPPLAYYVFTGESKSKIRSKWINSTSSGVVVINDCGMHIVEEDLPFGGTGSSGIGSYHGSKTFEIFSHYKPVMFKTGWLDIPMRYPPSTELGRKIISLLLWLSKKNVTPARVGKTALLIVLLYKVFR